MSTDEELVCPGATGPSSIGYVAGFTECQAYPGCYRGTLTLPGRADVRPWHCCHTHTDDGIAVACARAAAAEMGWALAGGSPLYSREALDAAAAEIARQQHGGPADPDDIKFASEVLTEAFTADAIREALRDRAGHQAGTAG
jgi:hypothetical protein